MTDAKSPHHVESLRAQMVYFGERTLEKVTYYLHTQVLPCSSSLKWDFQLHSHVFLLSFIQKRLMESYHVPGTVSGFGIFYLVSLKKNNPLPKIVLIIHPVVYPIIIIITSLYL